MTKEYKPAIIQVQRGKEGKTMKDARKVICFDMDGTIADLYSVEGWLTYLKQEDATPYIKANPMWDMGQLKNVLLKLAAQGWEIRVISWLSKDSTNAYKDEVRKAKLAWLKQYDFPFTVAHLVQYGTTKADCVRRIANPAILVDDNRQVRKGWTLGQTIDPTHGNLIKNLEKLLERN